MASLITTRAKPATCRGCGTPTLAGVAEGMPVVVDQQPIEPGQEYLILLDGRHTYALNPKGELWHRSEWRIRGGRLSILQTIHAQHACAKPHEQLQLNLDLDPPAA